MPTPIEVFTQLAIIGVALLFAKPSDFFRPYQKECFEKIHQAYEEEHRRCLTIMPCGTGKTRIFYTFMLEHDFSIAVFPTLALADQFIKDYANNETLTCEQFNFSYFRVCSQKESKTSTNPEEIKKFLKEKPKKIIAVTYNSLGLLFQCMREVKVTADTIIYDESHHVIGTKSQKIVFDTKAPVIFSWFFTATPNNENGIIMYDSTSEKAGDCGPCIFRYTLAQAIEDGYAQDFNLCILLNHCTDVENESEEDKQKRILKMIANVIVTQDCHRVILNHAFVENDKTEKTNVCDFVTDKNKKFLIEEIRKLDKEKKYKNIVYDGVHAKSRNRKQCINDFNNPDPKGEENIRIISQCRMMSEGIDTKIADMTIFIDVTSSTIQIIQIIGRITRLKDHHRPGIVLLPVVLDLDKFFACESKEERDVMLREGINKEKNYNQILNVVSALREDDPETYDLCLKYPSRFSPEEMKNSFQQSGRKLLESKGSLKDNIQFLVGDELLFDDESMQCDDEFTLENFAQFLHQPICVVTQSMEDGKTFENYGREFYSLDNDILELFRNDEGLYQPIVKSSKKLLYSSSDADDDNSKNLEKPKRQPFTNKFKVLMDPDFAIRFDVDMDSIKQTLSGELLANLVNEICFDNFENRLQEWISQYQKLRHIPSKYSKDKDENRVAIWQSHQRHLFKTSKLTIERIDALNKTEGWKWEVDSFEANRQFWLSQFKKNRGHNPSPKSEDPDENRSAWWQSHQRQLFKKSQLTPERIDALNKTEGWKWEEVDSFEHKRLFWLSQYLKLRHIPSRTSKDTDQNRAANWQCDQRKLFKKSQLTPERIDALNKTEGWKWSGLQSSKSPTKSPKFFETIPQTEEAYHQNQEPPPLHNNDKKTNARTVSEVETEAHADEHHLSKKKNHSSPTLKTPEQCLAKAESTSLEELVAFKAKKMFAEQKKPYNPDVKQYEPNKLGANAMVADRVSRKIGHALILDTHAFVTRNALLCKGFKASEIFIPQMDREEYLRMKESHKEVFEMSLNDFLQNISDDGKKFSLAWFDYFCTFGGNDECRPVNDIDLYFSRGFADNESTFAVTFSKREQMEDDVFNRVDHSKEEINIIAKKWGYALTREKLFEYGSMYLIIWEVLLLR